MSTPDEMQKLYHEDMAELLAAPLTITEAFFYAAFIHRVFEKSIPLMRAMAVRQGCWKNGFSLKN